MKPAGRSSSGPVIDEAVFAWTAPEGITVTELNRPVTLAQVKEAWPEIEHILPAIEREMDLKKTGLLDDDFFDYVLRFQGDTEDDFLDLYYAHAPGEFAYELHSKFGLLGNGYVELNPEAWNVFERYFGGSRTARWVTANDEVFIVSSRHRLFTASS